MIKYFWQVKIEAFLCSGLNQGEGPLVSIDPGGRKLTCRGSDNPIERQKSKIEI